MWYFEYNRKFRGLMKDELDLFNSQRVSLFKSRMEAKGRDVIGAMVEQPVTKRWGLTTIVEEEED